MRCYIHILRALQNMHSSVLVMIRTIDTRAQFCRNMLKHGNKNVIYTCWSNKMIFMQFGNENMK